MQGVNTFYNKSFALAQNINASSTSGWNGGQGFAPIGQGQNNFIGTFDGQGFTINGLYINRPTGPTDTGVALFGEISSNSVIKNVGLTNINITGEFEVAGLVGFMDISTASVSNSYVTGNVKGGDALSSVVGGLVGTNDGAISTSYSATNVSGGTQIGGLIGFMGGGTVSTSYTAGTVAGAGSISTVGGLVGDLYAGAVSQSYSTSTVSGSQYVGGFLGILENTGSVSDSYALGNVTGSFGAGGLIGRMTGGSATRTYAAGKVLPTSGTFIGGLVGYQTGGTLSSSYFDTDTSGLNASQGVGSTTNASGVTGETTYAPSVTTPIGSGGFGWQACNCWTNNNADGSALPYFGGWQSSATVPAVISGTVYNPAMAARRSDRTSRRCPTSSTAPPRLRLRMAAVNMLSC